MGVDKYILTHVVLVQIVASVDCTAAGRGVSEAQPCRHLYPDLGVTPKSPIWFVARYTEYRTGEKGYSGYVPVTFRSSSPYRFYAFQ